MLVGNKFNLHPVPDPNLQIISDPAGSRIHNIGKRNQGSTVQKCSSQVSMRQQDLLMRIAGSFKTLDRSTGSTIRYKKEYSGQISRIHSIGVPYCTIVMSAGSTV
jgi:hypothetical protein